MAQALDAAGFQVRALARRAPSAPGWGAVEPDIVPGDLADPAALDRLVDGARVVVHSAGAIKAADRDAFMAVNRDGTARLAEAMLRRAPGAHMLVVSSLAARAPEVSDYAASKRAGETAAAEILGRVTVARPPAIYGPGDRETLTLFRAARSSPVFPILSETARLALIHVEDAAAQIAALAARPTGATHALADGRPQGYGWREIAAAAGQAVGRRPRPVPLSPRVLRLAVHGLGALARVAGKPPPVAADKLGELLHDDWAIRAEELAPNPKAPKYDIVTGFADAVAWYRGAKWLS